MKRGFTLIELLVVVLIIGILSAIALPQYEKAVIKSRVAKEWPALKAIDQAAIAYCLANPTAPYVDVNALDVPLTSGVWIAGGTSCSSILSSTEDAQTVGRVVPKAKIGTSGIVIGMGKGKRYCGGESDDTTVMAKVKQFCNSMGMSVEKAGLSQLANTYTQCTAMSRGCWTD